ncbi:MAG: SxtJ family membrane protein [Gemmatimonadales bacterium]
MEGERQLETGVPTRLTPAEGRKFGLLVGGAFLLLGALLWRRTHLAAAWISGGLGVALLMGGLAAPAQLGPVYRAWMALARVISKVTTPVFMSVMFFLVLTPAGFLVRLFGHRPLARSKDDTTYWQSRPAGSRRGDMDHQF